MTAIPRIFLAVAFLALAVPAGAQEPMPLPVTMLTPQLPLPPTAIRAFVQPLPVLDVAVEPLWAAYPRIETVLPAAVAAADGPYRIKMCEFQSNVLPPGTIAPGPNPTWVWGYAKGECPATRDTYLGPVFVTLRGTPTSIRFENALPKKAELSNVVAYKDSVDQTLHWANPGGVMCGMPGMGTAEGDACAYPFRGTAIPAVPHLHGGEVPPMLDGGPDAWFTSDAASPLRGPAYYTDARPDPLYAAAGNEAVYTYPNTQEAAPLWFHDHTLGATRLNVFAGLAGGYYLVDPEQDIPDALKDVSQVVPLILQDRMFDTAGELFFTSAGKGNIQWALNPEHPYWNPEFVGDVAVVNGKAWPYLEVEPKRYRFLFLNGSNARTYELFLADRVTKVKGPALHMIGTDGGYLDAALKIDPNAAKPGPTKLVLMPGERYEVVIDFSSLPVGTRLWLKNVAKTPYPAGGTPTGGMQQLMEFRVACPATGCGSGGLAFDPATNPAIRGAGSTVPALVNFATGKANVPFQQTRQLTLNEVMGTPVLAVDPVTGVQTAFPGGPLEVLVNNTKWAGMSARNDAGPDPANPPPSFRGDFVKLAGSWYSELPKEGETELWEIVNLTADSHPIHLHLVQFQVLNRQTFDFPKYDAAYNAAFPAVVDASGNPLMIGMNACALGMYCPGYGPPLDYFHGTPGKLGGNPDVAPFLKGVARPPEVQERGWKDTVQAPPGMVTRIAVRWAPTDKAASIPSAELYFPFDPNANSDFGYVWHCHIIDHEDNEMMRPDIVMPNAAAERTLQQGTDY